MDRKSNIKLYNYALIVFCFGVFVLFFAMLNFIIVYLGSPISTLNDAYYLEKYVNENNLSLPLPNSKVIILNNGYNNIDSYYDVSINDFAKKIKDKYIYTDLYDCKYYAYVWSEYWKHNRIKNNWKFKYVETENHIFSMIYNDIGYCILDNYNIFCMGIDENN